MAVIGTGQKKRTEIAWFMANSQTQRTEIWRGGLISMDCHRIQLFFSRLLLMRTEAGL